MAVVEVEAVRQPLQQGLAVMGQMALDMALEVEVVEQRLGLEAVAMVAMAQAASLW